MSSVDATQPLAARIHEFLLKRHSPFSNAADNDEDDRSSDRYEVEQGENWLRLLQKEGRSVLDDTQCTQATDVADRSQESTVYPSIVSLSNVGILEAPSDCCYICVDLDENVIAVKDMRIPETTLDGDDEDASSAPKLSTQLGINRKHSHEWEVLPRRQLRILVPGDHICTSIVNGMPEGHILEYTWRDKVPHVNDEILSPTLLTQPQQDDDEMSQDEDAAKTERILLGGESSKLEIMTNTQEPKDEDSDKTMDLEVGGSNAENNANRALMSIVLATQPESDDETDYEDHDKPEKKLDDQHEGSQKKEQESSKNENPKDAAANLSSVNIDETTEKYAASVRALVDDVDDETDVEDSSINNDVAKKDFTSEQAGDKDGEKIHTAESKSQLPQDSSEDNLVTGDNKQGNDPSVPGAAHKAIENSSAVTNGNSQNETSRVVFSPSLCGETEDPPESNPKPPAQNSASLLSPVKETDALEESVGQNSVSLLTPAKDTEERRGSTGQNSASLLSPAKHGNNATDEKMSESGDQNSVSLLDESEDEEATKKEDETLKDKKSDTNEEESGDQNSVSLLEQLDDEKAVIEDVPATDESTKTESRRVPEKKKGVLEVGPGSLDASQPNHSAATKAPETLDDQKAGTKELGPSASGKENDDNSVDFGDILPDDDDEGSDTQLVEVSRNDEMRKSSSLPSNAVVSPSVNKEKKAVPLEEKSQSLNPKNEAATNETEQLVTKSTEPTLSKGKTGPLPRKSDSEQYNRSGKTKGPSKALEDEDDEFTFSDEAGLEPKRARLESPTTRRTPKQTYSKRVSPTESGDSPTTDIGKRSSQIVTTKSTIEGDVASSTPGASGDSRTSRKRTRQSPSVQSIAGNETPSFSQAESVGSRSARKRTRQSPAANATSGDSTPPVRVITTGIELTAGQKNVSTFLLFYG
jgi:hypothetical protein